MKPSPIDRELIYEISESEGVKSLLILIDAYVYNMERDVINCDINTHSFSQLAVLKARAEGARQLSAKIKSEINKIKGESRHG